MAPRTWKRPLTLMYDNNYKYGTNLYSGAIGDIEKKYHSSVSRTHLGSDRADLNLSTFAGSSLTAATSSSLTTHQRVQEALSSSAEFTSDVHDLRKVRSSGDFDVYRAYQDPWVPTLPSLANRTAFIDSMVHQEVEERATHRRRRRREDMAQLDLPAIHMTHNHPHPVTSYGGEASKVDVSFWMDKCRHMQLELDAVIQRVTEAEGKLNSEAAGAKSKIQQGISELTNEIEDTSRHSGELQKVIKRQGKHLMELQSLYEEIQRQLLHAGDELSNSTRRCLNLQGELDNVRHSFEQL